MEAQGQCVLLDSDTGTAGAQDIDMYQYLAFGGTAPVYYDVSVMEIAEEDAMTYYHEVDHGFSIKMDDDGTSLSGRPNLPTGDYTWTLTAADSDSQEATRTWNFRVMDVADYDSPTGANNTAESMTTAAGTEDWADFISSNYMPVEFNDQDDQDDAESPDGMVHGLDLGANSGVGSIDGIIGEEDGIGEADDVDALWVGGLTPDYVLEVGIEPKSELPTGIFNTVSVALYPHVSGKTKQSVIAPTEVDADGMATYKDIPCGFYYLEVTGEYTAAAGADGRNKVNRYTLSWTFEDQD
jgi:hypothetical protein